MFISIKNLRPWPAEQDYFDANSLDLLGLPPAENRNLLRDSRVKELHDEVDQPPDGRSFPAQEPLTLH
jgi:hypothetical protein